jgi:hypothetical protein
MTIYTHCRRKGKGADQVAMQVEANQLKLQAGKDQTFPSSDNRTNNRSHPSRCYPEMFPPGAAAKFGRSKEDIMASQDELFPKAVIAPKPKFVMGKPLVSNES